MEMVSTTQCGHKVAFLVTFEAQLANENTTTEFFNSLFNLRKLVLLKTESRESKQSRLVVILNNDNNVEVLSSGDLKVGDTKCTAKTISVNEAEELITKNKTKLYISSVPYGIDNIKLWNHFAQYGDLNYTYLIKKPDQQGGLGFGFVVFEDRGSFEKAISCKHYIEGKRIVCKEFQNKCHTTKQRKSQVPPDSKENALTQCIQPPPSESSSARDDAGSENQPQPERKKGVVSCGRDTGPADSAKGQAARIRKEAHRGRELLSDHTMYEPHKEPINPQYHPPFLEEEYYEEPYSAAREYRAEVSYYGYHGHDPYSYRIQRMASYQQSYDYYADSYGCSYSPWYRAPAYTQPVYHSSQSGYSSQLPPLRPFAQPTPQPVYVAHPRPQQTFPNCSSSHGRRAQRMGEFAFCQQQ